MKRSTKACLPILLLFALFSMASASHAGEALDNSPPLAHSADQILLASRDAAMGFATEQTYDVRTLPGSVNPPITNAKKKKQQKSKRRRADSFCPSGNLLPGDGGPLEITTPCTVAAGTYSYGFVNIHSGGELNFQDANIDFWATSILVEDGGNLTAGTPTRPIGSDNATNTVTIHLYGADTQKAGITCKTTTSDKSEICGVPKAMWTSKPSAKSNLPGGVSDYFYRYERLPADDNLTKDSYFGLKTLAVSYGGALKMFGLNGGVYPDHDSGRIPHVVSPSHVSWARLDQTICPAGGVTGCSSPDSTPDPTGTQVVLDRVVNWRTGDWIVVTATDFLPAHSEMLQIDSIQSDTKKSVITLKKAVQYPHNGKKYDLTQHHIPNRLELEGDLKTEVDTRAAVALLTRNIRIVSEACGTYDPKTNACSGLPGLCNGTWDPTKSQCNGLPQRPGSYFGGHTIARQGFKKFQMKGVEFKELGQGGRMAHSPVNFHMARQVPTAGEANATYVVACSVNHSMTRMYEIRGTQGVSLQRNVGYKSIGHGYMLAEGTETHNDLTANIGIYARPAVDYRDNPRKVPGILAQTTKYPDVDCPTGKCPNPKNSEYLVYQSDYVHPSVFFIMNGYNKFQDNMAVGAGTCGACYWVVPCTTSSLSTEQTWEGYAGIQRITPGTAPIKLFKGNFCSTAQYSLMTIGAVGTCKGVKTLDEIVADPYEFMPVVNPFAGSYDNNTDPETGHPPLYPNVSNGGNLQPWLCDEVQDPGCTTASAKPCTKGYTDNCVVNVIDSYTSSFHWAQQNFAAIWLRTYWFLFTDSVLTDALQGGLTMVSGGSWDQVINQYWALTRKSVFVGTTQDGNPYALNVGPANPQSPLQCDYRSPASYCRVTAKQNPLPDPTDHSKDEGINMPLDNFGVYQRLYNIYDGPVYQDSNAFLNIIPAKVTGCTGGGACGADYMYGRIMGIPSLPFDLNKTDPFDPDNCSLPNAAIGWKQPNGFFYPAAFHSTNLYFDKVDIRHYVIVPTFKPGTFEVDNDTVRNNYCTYPGVDPGSLFDASFTDVDRQTELNDDDGSLSGLKGATPLQIDGNGTISVNNDEFFKAPKLVLECESEQTCFQSPYDYVSAVVFPGCAAKDGAGCGTDWGIDCTTRSCYGVPLYRQYLLQEETKGPEQSVRMMGAAIYQRSTLIANNGEYYIDTTVSELEQSQNGTKTDGTHFPLTPSHNVFKASQSYNVFLLYAKPTTSITFKLYVGPGFDLTKDVKMIRAGTKRDDVVLVTPLEFKAYDWPQGWDPPSYSADGILTVKMDMSSASFTQDFENGLKESCGPLTFCEWDAAQYASDKAHPARACKCTRYPITKFTPPQPPIEQSPIDYQCSDDICGWSVKALECPSGGCIGFQVELPPGFIADGVDRRPPVTQPFPDSWNNVQWQTASEEIAGSCHYATPPSSLMSELGFDE
jgi:hypothetical protein